LGDGTFTFTSHHDHITVGKIPLVHRIVGHGRELSLPLLMGAALPLQEPFQFRLASVLSLWTAIAAISGFLERAPASSESWPWLAAYTALVTVEPGRLVVCVLQRIWPASPFASGHASLALLCLVYVGRTLLNPLNAGQSWVVSAEGPSPFSPAGGRYASSSSDSVKKAACPVVLGRGWRAGVDCGACWVFLFVFVLGMGSRRSRRSPRPWMRTNGKPALCLN
jgi:hypothetical protein